MAAPGDPLSRLAFTAANLLTSVRAQSEHGETAAANPPGDQGAGEQSDVQAEMPQRESGQRMHTVKDEPPDGADTQQHALPVRLRHGSMRQQQHVQAAGEPSSEDVMYDDGNTDDDETDNDDTATLGATGHTQTQRLQEHGHPSPRTQEADGARQPAGGPRHGWSRDDLQSAPQQSTLVPGSSATEGIEAQRPSTASQRTGSVLTEGEGDGDGDGSWADVSGGGGPAARGTVGGAAAGSERVSMLGRGKRPGKRRPTQFWQVFNDWWRSELERTGKRPGVDSVCGWYDANAAACWGDAAPSLDETRTHAKCLRSVGSIREYFREYRARKRAKTDAPAPPSQDAQPGGSGSAPAAAASAPENARSLPTEMQRDGLPCATAALSQQQLIKMAAQAAAAAALAAHRGPGGNGSGGGGGRVAPCPVGAEGGGTGPESFRGLTEAGGAARDTIAAQLPRQVLAAAAGAADRQAQERQQQRGQAQHQGPAAPWVAAGNLADDKGPSPAEAAAAAFAAAAAAAFAAATSPGGKHPAAPLLPMASSGGGASGSDGAAEQPRTTAPAFPERPYNGFVPDMGSSRGGGRERNGSRELPARPGTDGGVYPVAAAGHHLHHQHNHYYPYYAPESIRNGSGGGAGGKGDSYQRDHVHNEEHYSHQPLHPDAYASPYGHAHRRSPSSLPTSARYDDTFAFHSPYHPHSLPPHHPAVRMWLSHQPSPHDPHHAPPRHLTPPHRYSAHPAGYSGGGAPVPLPLSQQLLAAYPTADGAAVVHIAARGGGAPRRGPPSAPGAPPPGSTCPHQCYADPRHASQQQHELQQQQQHVCQQDDEHRQQYPSAGANRGSPREPSAAGGTVPPAAGTRAVESAIPAGGHGLAGHSVGGPHRQAPVREAPAHMDTAWAEASQGGVSRQEAHDTARRVSHSLGGHDETLTATALLAPGSAPDRQPATQQPQPQPSPRADDHPRPTQHQGQAPAAQHRQPVPTAQPQQQQQQQQRGPPPGYRVPGRPAPSLPHTGFRPTTPHHALPGRSASLTDLRHSAAVVPPRPGGHTTPRGVHVPTPSATPATSAPADNAGVLPKRPPIHNDATPDGRRASGAGKGPASTTSHTPLTGHEQPQHGSLQHAPRQPQQHGAVSGLSGPMDGSCSATAASNGAARPDRLPANASTGGSRPSPAQQQPPPQAGGPPALAQGDAAPVSAVAFVALVAGKESNVRKGERYSEQQHRQPEPRPSHAAAPSSEGGSDEAATRRDTNALPQPPAKLAALRGRSPIVGSATAAAAVSTGTLAPSGPGHPAVHDSRKHAAVIATGEVAPPQAARQARQDVDLGGAAAVAPAAVPGSGVACRGRAAEAGGPGRGGQCPSLRSLLARGEDEVVPLLQGCSRTQLAGLLLRALAVVRQKREHEEHLMDQLSQALELQGSLQAQLHAQKLEGARLYRSLMALRDMRSSGGGAGEDPGPDPLPLALGHRLALSAVGAGGWSGGPAAAAGGGAGTNGLPPALLRDLGSDVDMEEGGDGGGVYDGDGMALPAGGSSLSHTLAVEGDTEQHRSDLGMLQRKEGAAGAVAAGRLAERRDARASWNGMAADGVAATDVAAMAAAFARAGSAAAGMGVPIGLRSAAGADEGDDAGRGCSPAARAASHGPTVSGGHERPRSELSCLSGHFGQPHVGQGEQEGGEEAQGEEDRVHLSGCGGLAGFASRAAVIASPAQASGVAREALSRLGEGVTQRDAVPGETVRLQQHGQPQNDPSLRQRTAQGWDRWSAAEAAAMGSAGRNPVLAGAGRATAGASPGNRSDPDAAKHRYTPCPGAAADAQAVVVKAEPGCGAAGGPGATGPVKPGLLGPGAAAGAAPYSDGGSGSSSAF